MVDSKSIISRFNKLKGNNELLKDLDPSVVDNQLTSLRRQREKQLNEVERKQLKEKIKGFNNNKTRRELFGVKGSAKGKVNILKGNINKQKSILIDSHPLLKSKPKKFKMKIL